VILRLPRLELHLRSRPSRRAAGLMRPAGQAVLPSPRGPRAKGGGPDPPGGPDLARSDSLRFAPPVSGRQGRERAVELAGCGTHRDREWVCALRRPHTGVLRPSMTLRKESDTAMPVTVTPVEVWEPDLPTLARALQAWRGFMEWNRTCVHATEAERQLAAAEINALDRITAALPAAGHQGGMPVR